MYWGGGWYYKPSFDIGQPWFVFAPSWDTLHKRTNTSVERADEWSLYRYPSDRPDWLEYLDRKQIDRKEERLYIFNGYTKEFQKKKMSLLKLTALFIAQATILP
jgi:hypothetical protein